LQDLLGLLPALEQLERKSEYAGAEVFVQSGECLLVAIFQVVQQLRLELHILLEDTPPVAVWMSRAARRSRLEVRVPWLLPTSARLDGCERPRYLCLIAEVPDSRGA
jgi:ABC-type glycerol-3-phosphate transport system permease component